MILTRNRIRQPKAWIIVSLLCCITLMNCAPAVHIEGSNTADLGRYKTYQWVETRTAQNDSGSVTAFGEQSIHQAANRLLQQKGLREVTRQPDLLITHEILVERSRERRTDPVYSQPFSRYYYNPYFSRWGTLYYPSSFVGYDTYTVPVREGTVTITMMDANTDKAVWQAWATQQLDSRRFSSAELEKTVESILKKLKIPATTTGSTASTNQ